jgi:hypothetical protein
MGGLYRLQHELVTVFKKPGAHANDVRLGKRGRSRTDVWSYAGIKASGKMRDQDLASHPIVKPVQLVVDAILDVAARGECRARSQRRRWHHADRRAQERPHRLRYRARSLYVDVIVLRMQTLFGLTAINAAIGQTFEGVIEHRAATSPAGRSGQHRKARSAGGGRCLRTAATRSVTASLPHTAASSRASRATRRVASPAAKTS